MAARFLRIRLLWATREPRLRNVNLCLFLALLLVIALRLQWPLP